MVDKKGTAATGQGVMENWFTHKGASKFWEELGRTVATFGLLETIIAKTIFLLEGTAEPERELTEEDFLVWKKKLEKALSGTIGSLLTMLREVFEKDSRISSEEGNYVISNLEKLKPWRNILCHCAWIEFNTDGEGKPLFINRKNEKFDGLLSRHDISEIRRGTTELICFIIRTVESKGIEFGVDRGSLNQT